MSHDYRFHREATPAHRPASRPRALPNTIEARCKPRPIRRAETPEAIEDRRTAGRAAAIFGATTTLHEALRSRGFRSEPARNGRRCIMTIEGAVVGDFTASEAWAWLVAQEDAP